ncbi:MAG: U32 family peptidase [Caldilineaceae bacterium]|nr:U32 family peptidase [Caldilineaceae bacterium]
MDRQKPEIMSPAGYWPQLHAAVEAGADAVYFGLKHFSARAKVGFGMNELPDVVRTLHGRGVRGYLTFNTLLFDHELADAARTLAVIGRSGVDAIIVQDVTAAQLARRIAPDLEIHGSTQMSVTSAEGVELARQFGVSRVVLARELSLDEIRAIRGATACELEIFVHGALCVSYSGQCFSSEAWGGRSANRGQCAQACRLPYELMVDGEIRPLADARYLLSPGDLYALRQMPAIVEAGVSALKIEGRYKDANYVALTTAAYRRALDDAWAGREPGITQEQELQLEQVYSRGLGPYFISGTDHQAVVQGRAPRHRGVLMGRVSAVEQNGVLLAPAESHRVAPLKAGDGVVFDAAHRRSPEEREEGGRLYAVQPRKQGRLWLEFGNRDVDFARIQPGDLLWRTQDHAVEKAARPFTRATQPVYQRPVEISVNAAPGQPLIMTWRLAEHPAVSVTVRSPEPLGEARNRGLDQASLLRQLERLGNTPYRLGTLDARITGTPFAPASLLNELRREAVAALIAQQEMPPQATVTAPEAALAALRPEPRAHGRWTPPVPLLHLLVRSADQLEAAIEARPASITLDYLELYGLRDSVDRVQAAGIEARVASPRVLKPHEQRVVNFLLRLDCPILVRSGGLLQALQAVEHPPLSGDFSLNAANGPAARAYLAMGLSRITPTHDLNAAQITALAESIGGDRLEVIAYQHLPVFHTEHCVFCRFLSQGTSYKDCGHPCESHRVALKDQQGRSHPVMADVGCRNTVFGAEAQQAAGHLDEWLAAGIGHVRLEFVHESAAQVASLAGAFNEYVHKRIDASALNAKISALAPQGVTEGSLFVPPGYQAIPLLA